MGLAALSSAVHAGLFVPFGVDFAPGEPLEPLAFFDLVSFVSFDLVSFVVFDFVAFVAFVSFVAFVARGFSALSVQCRFQFSMNTNVLQVQVI